MITVGCPNCTKQYQIPDTALGDKGRTMQCKACGEKWFCTTQHIIMPELAPIAPEPDPWDAPTPATMKEQAQELVQSAISHVVEVAPVENAVTSLKRAASAADTDLGSDSDAEAMLKVQRKKRRMDVVKDYLTPQWICYGLAAIIVAVFLLLPSSFVRLNASYAKIYEALGYSINLEGLLIDNVITRYETQKGTQIMHIEGDVTNVTTEIKTLPRLKIYVKSSTGTDIYAWVVSAPKLSLLPGEAVRFKARYADPSPEAKQIHVKFFTSANSRK